MKITKQLIKRFEEAPVDVRHGTLGQGNTAKKNVTYANGWTFKLEVTYRHLEEAICYEKPLIECCFVYPTSKNSGYSTPVPESLAYVTKDLLDAAFINDDTHLSRVQDHNEAMRVFKKEMGIVL